MFTNKAEFKDAFINKLQTMCGKGLDEAGIHDCYIGLASLVRDCISRNWIQTNKQYWDQGEKQVYYFSIEFLLGKLLDCHLIHTGLRQICREGLHELGFDLEEVLAEEPDAGLGNGGLGRLAACFLDSMAALSLPGHGCGIRYRYGLFEQKIVNHHQVELPDHWLRDGYIWEFRKADKAVEVRFGGTVHCCKQGNGKLAFSQEDYESIKAVPYDIPVIGYGNNTVNTLRLWNAEPLQVDFDLSSFNHGDYLKAVQYKQAVERICKILYPDDSFYEGRLLRLKQQYFFVSAGLQSILRRFKRRKISIHALPSKVAVHINDTHPALAVPELMRLLLDEEGLGWEAAWQITTETISYTNHTIMPEALEKWPVEMFRTLLPRIYMIVEEINRRFCEHVWNRYADWDKVREMSIILDEQVHMARLAVVGSYSVNGVAQIHSDILRKHVMGSFYNFSPHKFNNKTNGITHRRWLLKANPELAGLISQAISPGWIANPQELSNLMRYAADSGFQDQVAEIKRTKKNSLAHFITGKYGIKINLDSIFDIQIKRIHSYKRQILNALHIMDFYHRLKQNPDLPLTPRTFIFAGKAAPGYFIAKQTIKLINRLAELINGDKTIRDKLKVVFLENYSVSLGELLFPAADVSEQISTASKEASGTGNMKFMMNGAVTVGTLDGANVEIRAAVGDDNIVIFGLRAEQVLDYYRYGGYNAWDIYNNDGRVKRVLEQLVDGFFSGEKEEFRLLYDYLLLNNDEFFVLKDFSDYAAAHVRLESKYNDQREWWKMSIANIAHSGKFSSDRTISEYAQGIWSIKPVIIP